MHYWCNRRLLYCPISVCYLDDSAFSMPSGAKFVFSSQSSRVTRMFASFDLSACSISFVGMMGDFAVWVLWFHIIQYYQQLVYYYGNTFWNLDKAIMDLSAGELMYLIDDNGGSEIYIEIYSYYNVGSITKHSWVVFWMVNVTLWSMYYK